MLVMRPISPTTDEEALLAAIAEDPLDDAPRLVYADWLQERGLEAKADYVRTVVRLVHPPEDPGEVERCVALADELDADWRQAVGGRFEVMMEGPGAIAIFAHMVQSLLNLAAREPIDVWTPGEPVRLKGSLTREDAEGHVRAFGRLLPRSGDDGAPSVRLFVRPMAAE